ncbi:MAG: cysteine desulfurase [Candidatus Pacebacteria bacterium]|nr:cysteine desulfurase [Candidatus Paceibacterota bacterium]
MNSFFSKFGQKLSQNLSLKNNQMRIYLDYTSMTPVDERVIKFVSKISKEYPANPSSLYREGVESFKQLEQARAKVAKHLESHADEIVFTSGGTESNNLAIQGVLKAYRANLQKVDKVEKGDDTNKMSVGSLSSQIRPHIISSVIEHPAVRELLLQYQESGECDVTFIPVGSDGIVDLKELKKALRPETILVSIMYVNNEIGTIQPISEISKIVRHYKKAKLELVVEKNEKPMTYSSIYPLVHTDACQAVLFCSLRIPTLGVDMMTLDSAKFYGPRSVGALYIKRSVIQSKSISSIQIGGSQENDLRAGTENVAGISGFAYAMDLAIAEKDKESARLGKMRDFLVDEIKKAESAEKIPKIIFNGTYENDHYGNALRVPNNLNMCVEGMDAEYAVLRLDVRGVCVSSVTSCRSKNEDSTSYVVEALSTGVKKNDEASNNGGEDTNNSSKNCGKSSLRITLGRFTTMGDVRSLLKTLVEVIGK